MKIIKVLEMKLIERTLLLDLVKRGRMKRTIYYILAFALCSCAVQRTTTGIEGMSELSVETLNTLTK